jgi:hypothetical protein
MRGKNSRLRGVRNLHVRVPAEIGRLFRLRINKNAIFLTTKAEEVYENKKH